MKSHKEKRAKKGKSNATSDFKSSRILINVENNLDLLLKLESGELHLYRRTIASLTKIKKIGLKLVALEFIDSVRLNLSLHLICFLKCSTVKPRFNGQMRTNDSPLLEKVR